MDKGDRLARRLCPVCFSLFTVVTSKKYCCNECADKAGYPIKRAWDKRNPSYHRQHRAKLKARVYNLLGNKCSACSNTDFRVLQIDHINGGGSKEVKSLGLGNALYKHILKVQGQGYQVLCANCNWIKRYEEREHVKLYD